MGIWRYVCNFDNFVVKKGKKDDEDAQTYMRRLRLPGYGLHSFCRWVSTEVVFGVFAHVGKSFVLHGGEGG